VAPLRGAPVGAARIPGVVTGGTTHPPATSHTQVPRASAVPPKDGGKPALPPPIASFGARAVTIQARSSYDLKG